MVKERREKDMRSWKEEKKAMEEIGDGNSKIERRRWR